MRRIIASLIDAPGPTYKELGRLKTDYPRVPIMALTATANKRVQQDVKQNLHITGCVELCQSFNRPNLRYEVRPKTKGFMAEMAETIKRDYPGQCGIIYCFSQRSTEETAAQLRKTYGIEAQHFHAGMNPKDKQRIQRAWTDGQFDVICATIACVGERSERG